MDLSTIIAIIVVIFSTAYLLVQRGWKSGVITILFVLGCLLLYAITIKFWGEEGKRYLAYVFGIIAVIVFCVRLKQGKSIW